MSKLLDSIVLSSDEDSSTENVVISDEGSPPHEEESSDEDSPPNKVNILVNIYLNLQLINSYLFLVIECLFKM